MSELDPFYLVKQEVQDSVNKLQSTLGRWEQLPFSATERIGLSKELSSACGSIEWQHESHILILTTIAEGIHPATNNVDELDRATGVAARDPARYSVDATEIERRQKWTASTRSQVQSISKRIQSADESNIGLENGQTKRQELMRIDHQFDPELNHTAHDSLFVESDRQALIIKEQDEDLDDLSATIERLGDVGLSIHAELSAQGGLMDEVGNDMDSTATRLNFVQKKVAMVMKKAGWKGQAFMIVCLVVLLLILILLIFSA